jgi:cytochrome c oxidase subunit 2
MKLVIQVIAVVVGIGALSYGVLRWLNSGSGGVPQVLSPAERALALAESRGCLACHSLEGNPGIGPSWLSSWGTQRRFVDGSTAVVDEAYMRESMLAPAVRVVEGYDNVMLPTGFTDAEIELMTGFIRNLQPQTAASEQGSGSG